MKKDWKEKASSAAFIVASVIGFAVSIWSIYLNRAASAAVAAAFCMAFIILRHLPVLDSFEAFSMKATFARKVAEADKVLTLLRETGHTLARMSYFQLAVGDRMTSLAWDRKMAIASELEERLRSLELDDAAIRDAKAPLLNVVAVDLYSAFEHIAGKLRQEASNEAGRQMNALSAMNYSEPDYKAKIEKLEDQRKLISDAGSSQFPALTDLPEKIDLETLTASKMLGVSLPGAEADRIETFRKKIVRMGNECWLAGSLTKESQAFLAENIHRDALFVEVMGRPPIRA